MSIVEEIQELRKKIREQFGVEASIDISVHDHVNPIITRELANYISLEVASNITPDNIRQYVNHSSDNYHWVKLATNDFELAVFYPEGVAEHAGESGPVCPGAA